MTHRRPRSEWDGRDFLAWRDRLGLTIGLAAEVLGVSRRTVQNYERASDIKAMVTYACRYVVEHPEILAKHGILPPASGFIAPALAGEPTQTGGFYVEPVQS